MSVFRGVTAAFVAAVLAAGEADAQFATVGAGALIVEQTQFAVGELNAQTSPFHGVRAYTTLSWSKESVAPTVITAAERSFALPRAFLGAGAGLLWLEGNDYRPYPIVVSSVVVPLPVPRTAVVAIASTQPFQDFAWSLVLKASFTVWFVR